MKKLNPHKGGNFLKEEFKEIELYGRKYMVSNYGKVVGARGELKQRLNRDGYLEVTVGDDGRRNSVRVHRLVAKLFVEGESETRNEVNHLDRNRANPRADNLEWATRHENVLHSAKVGRYKDSKIGGKNGRAILTEEDVYDIRLLFDNGILTQKELASSYGVGWSTIHNICFRLTWTHLI